MARRAALLVLVVTTLFVATVPVSAGGGRRRVLSDDYQGATGVELRAPFFSTSLVVQCTPSNRACASFPVRSRDSHFTVAVADQTTLPVALALTAESGELIGILCGTRPTPFRVPARGDLIWAAALVGTCRGSPLPSLPTTGTITVTIYSSL